MEQKMYEQKNGDLLKIISPSSKYRYYICESLVYKNRLEVRIDHIKNGTVNNPQKEVYEFQNKLWPQNCGDILKILEKTNLKDKDGSFLYRCTFIRYPYEILTSNKQMIKRGNIVNPRIEQEEFINKLWPQNCGDILKIIKKSNKKQGGYLWEAEFIKYPYKVVVSKVHIKEGSVVNPLIEQNNFINKIFVQNCGDSLKVIKKSDKKNASNNDFLFECEFINYFSKVFAPKQRILNGQVNNPALPWQSKENLEKYLKTNFKNKKPSLQEVAKSLQIAICTIGHKINEFNLRKYISYYKNYEENTLRNFISKYATCEPEEYYISDKNKKFFGIDVYIPNKKLGFEFNGTYWHSELFKESNYHQYKSLVAQENGISLIHIWEHEWNDSLKRPILESLIKSKLGKFSQKIGASKCQVKELTYKKYADFCNENHLQGEAGAKIKLGLFYKDKLVQIMSFGVPRFADSFEWEIIRECSKLDIIIIGGKEKLWSYFVKKYNPKSVLSYCDFSKFSGNSYLKLGFKKERLNKPGFAWYDEKTRTIKWRNPYKHNEYKNKYIKVFDCGQLVFTWKNNK